MPRLTVKELKLIVDENFSRLDSKIDELKKSGTSTVDPAINVTGIEKEIKGLRARLNVQSRSIDKLASAIENLEPVPQQNNWMKRQWVKIKNRIETYRNR